MRCHLWIGLLGLLLTSLVASCSATRYVEDGSMLLSQVRIESDSLKNIGLEPRELINYIGQHPNQRLMGLFNWSLGLYNLSDLNSNSWLNRRLRSWGQPPVIYSEQEAEYGCTSLASALYNRGFLRAHVDYRLDTIAPKRIRLTYQLHPGDLYRIGQTDLHLADTTLLQYLAPSDTLALKLHFPSERYTSWLSPGKALAPEAMQMERQRLTHILRNRGHWDLRADQVHFDIDTLSGHEQCWVRTNIEAIHRPYRIGQVRLRHLGPMGQDTQMRHDRVGALEISTSAAHLVRPKVLARRVWIRPGNLYTQEANIRTSAALSDLGAVSYVDIQYHPDTLASVPTLICDITTTAERSKEFTADLVGTHSSGNLGTNASVSFGHNNLLGGSEEFRLLARIGYENLKHAAHDHLSYGVEASLSFPRPFLWVGRQTQHRPTKSRTDYRLSYDHQRRPEFTRDLLSASWSYAWQRFADAAARYSLKLLEVDYMRFSYIDQSFIGSLPTITRLLNYRDQFVVSSSAQMTYASRSDSRYAFSPWLHNLRLYAQSAGNMLYGLSTLLGGERDRFGAFSLMNINYAQFIRAELDYSGLYRFAGKHAIAYHGALAMVYPYGNSRILPVDLRYFSGGANSVRGWGVRGLGPGAMPERAGTSIFHQVGDIKLDLSSELRLRVARSWELAWFIDAGNIWTIYPYESQPQGEFRLDKFYKQIALASGVGLRWDFDFFLLRLDTGFKIYDPQAETSRNRWPIGRRSLRNIAAIHFAIGYPF